MGANRSKLPERVQWIKKLQIELNKTHTEKEFYYIIWLLNDETIGHSNINNIEFGKSATMHLHLWKSKKRKSGLGEELLLLTIPYYFDTFKLEYLVCEPYFENIAPNKVLKKIGFELTRTYDTTPGWINFRQTVNRYVLRKNN
jgi:RimJ/RimL family protein N-acetyltransferase